MEVTSDQFQLKNILVDLEREHEHLQGAVNQLQYAIDRREIDIKKLIADKELNDIRGNATKSTYALTPLKKSQSVNFSNRNYHQSNVDGDNLSPIQQSSSLFQKQIDELLDSITKKSEEILSLVKL